MNTLEKIYQKIFDNNSKKINAKSVRESFALMDEKIDMRSQDLQGYLKISDPKPTVAGKYELSEVGSYVNLTPSNVPIVTKAGYFNTVYFDGTNFTFNEIAMPTVDVKIEQWVAGTYTVGQLAYNNGVTYRAKQTTTQEPTDTDTQWEVINNNTIAIKRGYQFGFGSKNLFNEEEKMFNGKTYIIDPSNGIARTSTTPDMFVSNLIYIESGQTQITLSAQGNFNKVYGWRFLDVNGNILTFGANGDAVNIFTLTIPNKAVYFQFSERSSTVRNIQVEYGNVATEYALFNPNYKISSKILSSIGFRFGFGSKNLFNKNEKAFGGGKYIIDVSTANGGTVRTTTTDMFVSNLIPMESGQTQITLSCSSNFNKVYGWRFLDVNGNVINNGANGDAVKFFTLAIPNGAKYFQFSELNTNIESIQVEYGSVATEYALFNPQANNNSKLTQSYGGYLGQGNINLFNKNEKAFGGGKYIIDGSNGVARTSTADSFVSNLIYIESGQTQITLSSNGNFNRVWGWRFFNINGDILTFGRNGDNVNTFTLDIPANAVYFQFSELNTIGLIQVEYGSVATEYNDLSTVNYINFKLPTQIPLVINKKQTIYIPNFTGDRTINPNNKTVVKGAPLYAYDNFSIFGSIDKNYTASFVTYFGNIPYTLGKVNLIGIDKAINNGKNPNILTIGSSSTEIGQYISSLNSNLIADGVTPNWIGAMHTFNDWNVRSENQTGSTLLASMMSNITNSTAYIIEVTGIQEKNMPINWLNYVSYNGNGFKWQIWGYKLDANGNGKIRLVGPSNATLPTSGTITKAAGIGDSTINFTNAVQVNKNPFWNTNTNNFDSDGIRNYLNIWNFNIPDILIIGFYGNDVPVTSTDTTIVNYVNNIDLFINTMKEVNPNLKVIITPPGHPAINSLNEDYIVKKNVLFSTMTKLLNKYKNSTSVFICPAYAFTDPLNGFGTTTQSYSNRFPNATTTITTDAVHANEGGMYQIGDAITNYVHYALTL